MKQYATYLRVSTTKQGNSGLGLEAQREICVRYAKENPIIAEFVEVESGKNNERDVLHEAIYYCKKHNCTLLIAKLDRLSRSMSFIFQMLDSKLDFEAADLPTFNTLTVGIFASMAQHERETISSRTKSALQAKIARGEKWWRDFSPEERKRGSEKGVATLKRKQTKVRDAVQNLAKRGLTIPQIQETMGAIGFKTKTGNLLSYSTIHKYYKGVRQG